MAFTLTNSGNTLASVMTVSSIVPYTTDLTPGTGIFAGTAVDRPCQLSGYSGGFSPVAG